MEFFATGSSMPGLVHADSETTDTRERIKKANEQAFQGSLDSRVRGTAAKIVGRTRNMYRDAPRRLIRWIKRNIPYTREARGVEILQGPITSLTIQTGDCDDYAILLTALARSIGLGLLCGGGSGVDRHPRAPSRDRVRQRHGGTTTKSPTILPMAERGRGRYTGDQSRRWRRGTTRQNQPTRDSTSRWADVRTYTLIRRCLHPRPNSPNRR